MHKGSCSRGCLQYDPAVLGPSTNNTPWQIHLLPGKAVSALHLHSGLHNQVPADVSPRLVICVSLRRCHLAQQSATPEGADASVLLGVWPVLWRTPQHASICVYAGSSDMRYVTAVWATGQYVTGPSEAGGPCQSITFQQNGECATQVSGRIG